MRPTTFALLLLGSCVTPALAEDATSIAKVIQQGDTFPASLGYAAIAAATAAAGVLTGVITKLWYRLNEREAAMQAIIDKIKSENTKELDDLKKENAREREEDRKACAAEVAELRDRLEKEQAERRQDAERLLREQKEIMREVMTTCTAISNALAKNTEATEKVLDHIAKKPT